MKVTKSITVVLFTVLTSAVCLIGDNLTSPQSTPGGSIDESDWGIYMDAPAYHLKLAHHYYQMGDTAHAAVELTRCNTFLTFQIQRLTSAQNEIDVLNKRLALTSEKDTALFNSGVTQLLHTVNHKYRMLPLQVYGNPLFKNTDTYHFDKATLLMNQGNYRFSADEIRLGAAFLKLKAAALGITPWVDVDSTVATLRQLALAVDAGKITSVTKLTPVFLHATDLFKNK